MHLQERIESLKGELATLFGGTTGTGAKRGRKPGRKAKSKPLAVSGDELATTPGTTKRGRKKKRVMSPEAREKIAAAQKRRWANQKKQAKKGE